MNSTYPEGEALPHGDGEGVGHQVLLPVARQGAAGVVGSQVVQHGRISHHEVQRARPGEERSREERESHVGILDVHVRQPSIDGGEAPANVETQQQLTHDGGFVGSAGFMVSLATNCSN